MVNSVSSPPPAVAGIPAMGVPAVPHPGAFGIGASYGVAGVSGSTLPCPSAPPAPVVSEWEVEIKAGKWFAFPPEANVLVRAAIAAGNVVVDIGNNRVVYLDKMVQCRSDTGKTRKIRAKVSSSPAAASSGAPVLFPPRPGALDWEVDADTGWVALGPVEAGVVTAAFLAGQPSVEYQGYKGRKFRVTLDSPDGFFQTRSDLPAGATPTKRFLKATDSATGRMVTAAGARHPVAGGGAAAPPRVSSDFVWQVEVDSKTGGKKWIDFTARDSASLTDAYLSQKPDVKLKIRGKDYRVQLESEFIQFAGKAVKGRPVRCKRGSTVVKPLQRVGGGSDGGSSGGGGSSGAPRTHGTNPRGVDKNQKAALSKVRKESEPKSKEAMSKLMDKFKAARSSFSKSDLDTVLKYIGYKAEIHINLKCDKRIGSKPLLQVLVDDPDRRYKNQFETGASGGALSGSSRRSTEKQLFGSAYDSADGDKRCKYGNLNLLSSFLGDDRASHYGKSYFVLNDKEVRERTTITSGDSLGAVSRIQVGCLHPKHIAHVLNESIKISKNPKEMASVIDHLACSPEKPFTKAIDRSLLPQYQELQLHGSIDLARDVDELIIHPDELRSSGVREAASKFAAVFGARVRTLGAHGQVIPL